MIKQEKRTVETPVCSECVYCRPFEWSKRLRAWDCKHPEANDGSCRFALNLIGGRVNVNSVFADRPTIKTSPKWCPRRKNHDMLEEEAD